MIKFIDDIINSITMYRLVLYALIVIAVFAIIFGFSGMIPYGGLAQIYSVAILLIVCFSTNWLFSKLFRAPANVESWLITALILFLLFMPAQGVNDFYTLILAGIIAMASKYLLAINKKHIFNPAAVAAVILSLHPNTVALWWVGNPVIVPIVLITGLIIVRKIRKFSLFLAFLGAGFAGTTIYGILSNNLNLSLFSGMIASGPSIFLGTIMLTEPLTTPPTRKLQLIYGGLVGLLFTMQFNVGPLYSTPELALVIGNIFSFIVSPKLRLDLRLKQKKKIAKDIYEFIFEPETRLNNPPLRHEGYGGQAGQYLEWTLPHKNPDSRGVRRYFTIASSPTERELKLGIRISGLSSSFKKRLLAIGENDTVCASQLSGDFILPENHSAKLVFIAGGIGITPFRSMIKYLIDKQEKRTVVLFYFNKSVEEIAYKEIFEEAGRVIGLKTVYSLTDPGQIPSGWSGKIGRLDNKMLSEEVPEARSCIYYISGPNALANNYRKILVQFGIKKKDIKTDYFPGF